MAIIGVSKPKYAVYDTATGVPTYRDGGVLGKLVEVGIDVESSDDNNLYADNGIAESASGFTGGSLNLTTDDLSQEVAKVILGAREVPITDVEGLSDTEATELIFDNSQATPHLGIGFIIKKILGGVTKWRAVVLTKVMFSVPATAATTQGETIEWQTPELTGVITRDDTPMQIWKREATFSTEADAERYINARLNIKPAPLPELTVTSAAGTTAGNTVITVTPAKAAGNSYKYKTAASVILPHLGEVITAGYTDWNGTAEIAASTGQQIAVVEVTAANQAVAGGIATVTASAEAPMTAKKEV